MGLLTDRQYTLRIATEDMKRGLCPDIERKDSLVCLKVLEERKKERTYRERVVSHMG
jgi:hypothetical protein